MGSSSGETSLGRGDFAAAPEHAGGDVSFTTSSRVHGPAPSTPQCTTHSQAAAALRLAAKPERAAEGKRWGDGENKVEPSLIARPEARFPIYCWLSNRLPSALSVMLAATHPLGEGLAGHQRLNPASRLVAAAAAHPPPSSVDEGAGDRYLPPSRLGALLRQMSRQGEEEASPESLSFSFAILLRTKLEAAVMNRVRGAPPGLVSDVLFSYQVRLVRTLYAAGLDVALLEETAETSGSTLVVLVKARETKLLRREEKKLQCERYLKHGVLGGVKVCFGCASSLRAGSHAFFMMHSNDDYPSHAQTLLARADHAV